MPSHRVSLSAAKGLALVVAGHRIGTRFFAEFILSGD